MANVQFDEKWIDESLRDINAVHQEGCEMTRDQLVDMLESDALNTALRDRGHYAFTVDAKMSIDDKQHLFDVMPNSHLFEIDMRTGRAVSCAEARGQRAVARENEGKWKENKFLSNARVFVDGDNVLIEVYPDTTDSAGAGKAGVLLVAKPSASTQGVLDVEVRHGNPDAPGFVARVDTDEPLFELVHDIYRDTFPWGELSIRTKDENQAADLDPVKKNSSAVKQDKGIKPVSGLEP